MKTTMIFLALMTAFAASANVPASTSVAIPTMSVAKNGADNAPGDRKGGEGAGHAKNGADDTKTDDRGRHGAGHAKNGADNAPGDRKGGEGAGHA